MQAFSLAAGLGLLIAVASLVEKPENGLVVAALGPRGFSSFGSGPPEHRVNACGARGLSCSVTCGIFSDQGLVHVSCITTEPPGKVEDCFCLNSGITRDPLHS